MRAPEFWRRRGALSTLLLPAGWAYAWATRRRVARASGYRAPVPVVCVGNLGAGGSGKTPVALSLVARLALRGVSAHILSRGYKGKLAGPVRVDPTVHTVAEVGDEPLLLARRAAVWVAKDRAAGAKAAVEAGAGALVMDDGFQNPSVAKDLSLVVVDGGFGFGNRRVLPAGPLREPLSAGLARARAAVIVGDDRTAAARRIAEAQADLPVLQARLVPTEEPLDLAGRRVVAMAGIGRPDKFFETVVALGATLVEALPFPDHHAYSVDDIMLAAEIATERDAIVVTTEKDHVRLWPEAQNLVRAVPVALEWADEAAIDALLDSLLERDGFRSD